MNIDLTERCQELQTHLDSLITTDEKIDYLYSLKDEIGNSKVMKLWEKEISKPINTKELNVSVEKKIENYLKRLGKEKDYYKGKKDFTKRKKRFRKNLSKEDRIVWDANIFCDKNISKYFDIKRSEAHPKIKLDRVIELLKKFYKDDFDNGYKELLRFSKLIDLDLNEANQQFWEKYKSYKLNYNGKVHSSESIIPAENIGRGAIIDYEKVFTDNGFNNGELVKELREYINGINNLNSGKKQERNNLKLQTTNEGEIVNAVPTPTSSNRNKWIVWLGVLGSMASIISLLFMCNSGNEPEVKQLSVFVTDAKGNVVLENEGELNIPIGNRLLNRPIETNGRTNFGDITANNIGDTLTIGLKAEGWEIDGSNIFVFKGEPIKLIVKRDNSLGIIKGSVMTRDEQMAIDSAKVMINTDALIYTNKEGFFEIILPENMQIKKVTDRYKLTISKAGYQTTSELYQTKSSLAEIRLHKK